MVSARRLGILRDLGNLTGEYLMNIVNYFRNVDIDTSKAIARTKQEYASSVLKVIEQNPIDLPFAAFYFNTPDGMYKVPSTLRQLLTPEPYAAVPDGQKKTTSATQLVSSNSQHLRITSTLAFSVGVPIGKGNLPEKAAFTLDPDSFQVIDNPSLHRPFALRSSSDDLSNSSNDSLSVSSEASTIIPSVPNEPTSSSSSSKWPFYDIFAQTSAFHVEKIPVSVANTLERRGWGDVPREAVVVPIAAEGDGKTPRY